MLAGAVILRSLDKAVDTSEPMIARGYKGVIQFDPPRPVERNDIVFGFVASGITIFLYLVSGMQ